MSTTARTASVAELFADVARRVLADPSIAKTGPERQFLKDVQRSRYGFGAPEKLLALCERSTDIAVQEAFEAAARQHRREHCGSPLTTADEDLLELAETIAQGTTDVLQKRRQLDPSNHAIARELRDSLLREEEAARRYRECVELELPT